MGAVSDVVVICRVEAWEDCLMLASGFGPLESGATIIEKSLGRGAKKELAQLLGAGRKKSRESEAVKLDLQRCRRDIYRGSGLSIGRASAPLDYSSTV